MRKTIVRELINELEAEVNNGGFDQFFFNSAGDNTEETIQALKVIGANHTAGIVQLAASKFPSGMPPIDRFKRQGELQVISPESDLFEDLDEAFLEYRDDLASLVDGYEQ